nr:MAG TPA: hypothetical protein [Caudoviricetes sp.]
MAPENRGNNYGAMAGNINAPVKIYNNIEAKKRLHSLMPTFIEILAQITNTENPPSDSTVPLSYKIEDKIEYNQLLKYKSLVDEYGNYYLVCENAFIALDNIKNFSKERILKSISEKYKAEKRSLLSFNHNQEISEIDLIRNNSDYIIDQIISKIKEEIMINYNEEDIVFEDVEFCLPVFICYAFVECKILERPDNYDCISR